MTRIESFLILDHYLESDFIIPYLVLILSLKLDDPRHAVNWIMFQLSRISLETVINLR